MKQYVSIIITLLFCISLSGCQEEEVYYGSYRTKVHKAAEDTKAEKETDENITLENTGKNADTSSVQSIANEKAPISGEDETSPLLTNAENALNKAKLLLKHSHISYMQMVTDLQQWDFTYEEAVYAADNCGADWNEQARKALLSYMSINTYSYEEIIVLLQNEKFTSEQAVYAAESYFNNNNESQ